MLLETIRCENGVPLHLPYHQQRLEESLYALGSDASYDLKSLIFPPEEGLYRCRFLYDSAACRIEFHPYSPRTFTSLKIVSADTLDYRYKYADRSALDALYAQRGDCDDVLIVQHGTLKDTTIANIALWIEGKWLTPEVPLLKGTTRARLIHEKRIVPHPLTLDDLVRAEKIALMNAMVGFIEVEHGIIF